MSFPPVFLEHGFAGFTDSFLSAPAGSPDPAAERRQATEGCTNPSRAWDL